MVDHRFSNGLSPAPTSIQCGSDEEDYDDQEDRRHHQYVRQQQQLQQQSNNNNNSNGARMSSRSVRKSSRHTVLDDDDFSVAPSMDQDVKSVVSVGFDDVYKRGRKVRKQKKIETYVE
jgi:hypothetical protein